MKYIDFIFRFLFFIAPSLVTAGESPKCELYFKKVQACGQIEWVVKPKKVEIPTPKDQAEFKIQFFKKNRTHEKYTLAETIRVKLFMPSMGHGSQPTSVSQETDDQGHPIPGSYRVKDVLFSMPGDWEIRVELKKHDKVIDQATLPYQFY